MKKGVSGPVEQAGAIDRMQLTGLAFLFAETSSACSRPGN
jgi:hypothetical protein